MDESPIQREGQKGGGANARRYTGLSARLLATRNQWPREGEASRLHGLRKAVKRGKKNPPELGSTGGLSNGQVDYRRGK